MRFLVLFLFPLFLFADVASEKDTLANSLFTANDATVSSGSCSYGCRAVSSGYITQIVDIDAKSGTTQCEVFSVNDTTNPLGVNANQTNTACKDKASHDPNEYSDQLVSSNKESSYKLAGAKYDTGTITFSRFLSGMCTLDPDIIDFSATSTTGILSLKNQGSIYGTNVSTQSGSPELIATADRLNKSNLAYFANLFSNMSTIYSYLQNLLFTFVSAFFVIILGSQRLQAYLEKRDGDKDYLKKLYIPIVAVAFFYMPIPQENNMHSSIMQNIIRNFMATSTKIADKAAVIGANSYLQKLYSSVGANTMQGEATIYANRDNAKAQMDLYANTLSNMCKNRFPQAMTFQVSDADLEQQSIYNINQVQEGVTAKGCRAVERKWLVQSKVYKQYLAYSEQVKSSFSNNKLQGKLSQINTYLNNRQTELGWVNAALIPSAAITIQLMPLVQEATEQAQISADDNEKKINDNYKEDEDKSLWQTIKERGQNYIGQLVGKVAYMILPGANAIYEFGRDAIKAGADILGSVLALSGNVVAGAAVALVANNGGAQIGGLIFTATVLDYILDYLPLIASVIAGILAILGWIIELTKYFYVTPFVVAFAVTMRRVDKMVEFLVTGIAIFFKPTLLVMFIFLGLFLYWLSKDVFLAFALEQYNLLSSMNEGFIVSMLLNIVVVLLKIVSSIASTYFLWKLILTGPAYVMKLIGIDHAGEYTNLIQAAAQKLDKYSVQL